MVSMPQSFATCKLHGPRSLLRLHLFQCGYNDLNLALAENPIGLSLQQKLVVVSFAWEPQAPTQASRPRLVTVVNTCKAAPLIMP